MFVPFNPIPTFLYRHFYPCLTSFIRHFQVAKLGGGVRASVRVEFRKLFGVKGNASAWECDRGELIGTLPGTERDICTIYELIYSQKNSVMTYAQRGLYI